MRIVLVPGLMASGWTLDPIKEVIAQTHECFTPGFDTDTLLHGELDSLARTVRRLSPVIIVGHSAGSLLGVMLALADNPHILGIIGMGTPLTGYIKPRCYYFEARSVLGGLIPLFGPNEVKVFNTTHALLPDTKSVQDWVIEKIREIEGERE